jgi:hypothetical protein
MAEAFDASSTLVEDDGEAADIKVPYPHTCCSQIPLTYGGDATGLMTPLFVA